MLPPQSSRDVIKALERMRRAAIAQDAAALDQIVAAYRALYARMSDRLEAELSKMFRNGGDTASRAYITARLRSLLNQLGDELGRFTTYLQTALPGMADDAMLLGGADAYRTMRLLSPAGLPLVNVRFDRLPRDAINAILGFLAPDSALWDRLRAMSPVYSDKIGDALIDAIAQGWNPAKTARGIAPLLDAAQNELLGGMGKALSDALRTARTVQLWSYREAQRANYVANNDVVTGWQWSAELDDLTCMSCVAMHGSVHSLDEPLDDHHNGRCAALPIVLGNALYDEDAGKQWFDGQDTEMQRSMMGKSKFAAYEEGRFEFSQLSAQAPDDVYGTMRSEAALKDLVGE